MGEADVRIIAKGNDQIVIRNDGQFPIGDVTAENLNGLTVNHRGSQATWVESWEVIPPGREFVFERRVDDFAISELRFQVNYSVSRCPHRSYDVSVDSAQKE